MVALVVLVLAAGAVGGWGGAALVAWLGAPTAVQVAAAFVGGCIAAVWTFVFAGIIAALVA